MTTFTSRNSYFGSETATFTSRNSYFGQKQPLLVRNGYFFGQKQPLLGSETAFLVRNSHFWVSKTVTFVVNAALYLPVYRTPLPHLPVYRTLLPHRPRCWCVHVRHAHWLDHQNSVKHAILTVNQGTWLKRDPATLFTKSGKTAFPRQKPGYFQ